MQIGGPEYAGIIGNGASRIGFKPVEFQKRQMKTFACNAFYRDYDPTFEFPDYLVAIDSGMIMEIIQSKFPKDRFIIPPPYQHWEPPECNPNRPRSNAGMNAMLEAIKRKHYKLYCIGFDFLIPNAVQSVSNLYDGSRNYGPETRASVLDNPGRMNYLNYIAEQNPDVEFTFLYPTRLMFTPNGFVENIKIMSFEEFSLHG